MEITYQNKPGDTRAVYEFLISKTAWGKKYCLRALVNMQVFTIIYFLFIGIVIFGFTNSVKDTLISSGSLILFYELLILIISKFKLRQYYGVQGLIQSEKTWTPKVWKIYYQPKTIAIEKEWFNYSYSGAQHKYKWDMIDIIDSTPYFIFITIGSSFFTIPNRGFESQQSFIEFASTLVNFWKVESGITSNVEGEISSLS